MVYLDTHVVIWLYEGSLNLLSKEALCVIEQNDLFVSPMVEMELQFLRETKRIKKNPAEVLDALFKDINLKICDQDFQAVIGEALGQHWTKDPFDRIIVAQAALHNNILITKDETIRQHYRRAVW